MEIDHLTVPVQDYEAAKAFYSAALRPLGFELLMDWIQRRRAYFGVAPAPSSLWLVESAFFGTLEIAVAAPSVDAVDAFYFAAVSGERPLRGRAPGSWRTAAATITRRACWIPTGPAGSRAPRCRGRRRLTRVPFRH